MKIKDKKIVVVGLGRTGMATARFLHQNGARVLVSDAADDTKLEDAAAILQEMGVAVELGPHRISAFQNADFIVVSPGVAHTIEPIKKAKSQGIPVMGELELASRFIHAPIVAVTGTNGKTTTTELLGQMLKNSGISVFLGGNIGNPLIEYVSSGKKKQVIVAEISSFQLDTIASFRPKVSVLLNITADHLDRYPDFEAYANSKIRIFNNQRSDDVAVLNGSDPLIRNKTKDIKSQRLFFPSPAENEKGAVLNGKQIILKLDKLEQIQADIRARQSTRIPSTRSGPEQIAGSSLQAAFRDHEYLDISKTSLQGRHNFENACAASLAALAVGATIEGIQKTLDHFKGLAHRLEHVATVNEVHFYNDSKATNLDGVLRALDCFEKPVLLLMGGRDKGSDFSVLENSIRKHAKKIIVMGEAAEAIRSALGHWVPTEFADSMKDAVQMAYQDADPQDVVVLSPGCSSFDWYANYAERGDDFRRAVDEIKKSF